MLLPATSAPGLGSSLAHLHRDCARPGHICAGTGLTPATSALGLASAPGRDPTPCASLRERSMQWYAARCMCNPDTLYVQLTRCMCNRLGARRSSCATLYVCGPPKPMGSFGRGVLQRNGCHEVTDGRCGAGPTGPPVQEWDVDGARRPMLVPADGCAACGRSDLQKRTPWRSHTRAHTC